MHKEATPHFDGRRDGFITDSQGIKLGVRFNKTKQNSYHVDSLNNDDLKEFQSMFRGKVIERNSEHEKTEP